MTSDQIIARGKSVVRLEREALGMVEERLGESFAEAVTMIAKCTGRVIVTGVGKSGLIGRKIAATLTSTGSPAIFLHPMDSVHGDLGIVGPEDIAILLSKSGESDELLGLLEHLQGLGVRTVAITGEMGSALARLCDVALDAWVREEACPHDLAPTTSTTAALALGDALAVALLEYKGFRREDFARLHPGGALGRRLVTRVDEIMLTEPLPILPQGSSLRQAVVVLAEQRGIVLVTDDDRRLHGVLTAGDLTRLMEHEMDVLSQPVERIMTRTPRSAESGELASAVAFRMESFGIMAMPVLDGSERLVGVVHLHDLLRARVA
ncbi:MAG: KpsF/GutQ family protein [Gemmatimonadetes bacterium]|nr:KpsF/GutQ family protein [Gemmatimonadota bacterium]